MRMRDGFNEPWDNTSSWTLTGSGVTATADPANNKVAIVGSTSTTHGKLVYNAGTFACPSGQVDRLWLDLIVPNADSHNGAADSYEMRVKVVDTANHCGNAMYLAAFENAPWSVAATYVQGAAEGVRGTSATYLDPGRRVLGIEIDNVNSLLKVVIFSSADDPTLDATWAGATAVDSFGFAGISPAFDPTSYTVEVEVIGFSGSASTAHLGELNAGVGGGGGSTGTAVFGVDRRRRAVAAAT